jgi:hypothetical protein
MFDFTRALMLQASDALLVTKSGGFQKAQLRSNHLSYFCAGA